MMSRGLALIRSKEYLKLLPSVVCSLFILIYFLLNIFSVGGDAFVINLNNNISTLMAIGVTTFAFLVWSQFKAEKQSSGIWAGFAIGWVLWTIAEIWWAIASNLGSEVPYPSAADFFWLAGYIPMSIALWLRIRSLPKINFRLMSAVLWGISALILGWTIVFILAPILANYDPKLLLMSVLNILYPLVDLILLILALRIFFAFQQGSYGRIWLWLSAGFSLHSFSNLVFSYASDNQIYYPLGKVNLISTIGIDIPYTLGYLACLIGLVVLWNTKTVYQPKPRLASLLPFIPNTHVIIFTKNNLIVTGFSHNFQEVFLVDENNGKTLSDHLGITEVEAKLIDAEISTRDFLEDRRIIVRTCNGEQEASLCGLPIFDPNGNYLGAIFLIRMMMASNSLDGYLTEYEKSVLSNVIKKAGLKEAGEKEIKEFLSNYYSSYFKTLYNQTLIKGGAAMAEALLAELQSAVKAHGWNVSIQADNPLDATRSSLSEIQDALPFLLETAKKFVTKIIGEKNIRDELKQVDSHFNHAEHENAAYFIARPTV